MRENVLFAKTIQDFQKKKVRSGYESRSTMCLDVAIHFLLLLDYKRKQRELYRKTQ